jgi:hypothetical protein
MNSIKLQCERCGVCISDKASVRIGSDLGVRCNFCYDTIINIQRQALTGSITEQGNSNTTASSNPKTRDSSHKVPLSLCPPAVRFAIARVLKIGGEKPGRWHWNWRDEHVKATQYIDAIHRHIALFESGEDLDEEMTELAGTPIHHLDAAASSLAILIDAREAGTLIDDRPKKGAGAAEMLKRFQSVCKSE